MKKIHLKPWQRYVLVFVLLLAVNGLLRWISPGEEWKDGNLLVSLVTAAQALSPPTACASRTSNTKIK